MSYRDDDREDDKKKKQKRPQYMIWWKPEGTRRLEYGPIYDKKTAKRDANFYQNLYGAGNGGWEVVIDRPVRERYDRR